MADYSDSKKGPNVFPEQYTETPWGRLETLIDPERLVEDFLWGLNLTSKFINPVTKKPWTINTEQMKRLINKAVNLAETDLGLWIMPVQFDSKLPYDYRDYKQYGYFQLPNKPVASVESMAVKFANDITNFTIPKDWWELSNLVYGQVNLIPITANGVFSSQNNDSTSFTSILILSLWNRDWVSALFSIKYTCGFPNGLVPTQINEYIGTIVAIDILSKLGATYAHVTSASIGSDGLSQSFSGPGPNIYAVRIGDLEKKRDDLKKRIERVYRRVVASVL